jgi:hypothetical protein
MRLRHFTVLRLHASIMIPGCLLRTLHTFGSILEMLGCSTLGSFLCVVRMRGVRPIGLGTMPRSKFIIVH